jgi:hypothetical protein
MNATNYAHIAAFAPQDETIQPDVYVTYDDTTGVTIFFEDDEIVLNLGYAD